MNWCITCRQLHPLGLQTLLLMFGITALLVPHAHIPKSSVPLEARSSHSRIFLRQGVLVLCGQRRENDTRSQQTLVPPLLVIPVTATWYQHEKQAFCVVLCQVMVEEDARDSCLTWTTMVLQGRTRGPSLSSQSSGLISFLILHHAHCAGQLYILWPGAWGSLRRLLPSLMLSSPTCWDNLNLLEGFYTSWRKGDHDLSSICFQQLLDL